MRKHYYRRKKINPLFIIIISLTVVSFSYAYLSTNLKIIGNVKGTYTEGNYTIDPSSNPNLKITKISTNFWQENGLYKYQYLFYLNNIGNVDYDNFKVTFTFNNKLETAEVWNYSSNLNNYTLIVSNTAYDLLVGGTREIGFIVTSKKANLNITTIKLEATSTAGEIDPSKLVVVFTKTSGWGNYTYQYDVTITNKTGVKITYWQLDITLPSGTSYVSGWNGIFETNNNILTVKNASHNGRLNNNESTTFGLQLQTNIVNFIPTEIRRIVR